MNAPLTGTPPADLVVTEKLYERPTRAPDLQAEAEAVQELSSRLIADAESAVQRFLELAMKLCRAGSAGLSVLTQSAAGEPMFRWEAIAGELAPYVGRTAPRHASSCGLCLDHGRPILAYRPGRHFPLLGNEAPEVVEALLVPLYDAGNEPLGVLWIVSHHEPNGFQQHGFDAEDARIMQHLAMQLVLALKILRSQAQHQQTVAAMSQTLATKDAVVKEVNHRVKNTIQTAVALLRLQRRAARSEEAKVVLDEAEKRLSVFSSIHQMLYQGASDSQRISMEAIMRGLAESLRKSFADVSERVQLKVSVEPTALDPDRAIPLALIANEAITNAFKHGFPNGRSGTVQVRLQNSGDGVLCLVIDDDGVGMASHAGSDSLGLQLIRSFAKQLGGQLSIKGQGGTRIAVSLKEPQGEAPGLVRGEGAPSLAAAR